MKKYHVILIAAFLFTCALCAVLAQGDTLFIDNKPVSISIRHWEGKAWVPLEDFCKKAGMACTSSGSEYYVFRVAGKTASSKKGSVSGKYYFKITNAFGDFNLKVMVNGEYVGSYNGNAGAEVTSMIKRGENALEIKYNQESEAGSYKVLLFKKISGKDIVKAKWDAMWPFEDETSGKKTFTFNE